MKDSDDKLMAAIGVLVVIALIVVGILAYRNYMTCLDNGGHWSRENCRLVWDQNCSTYSDGKHSSTVCVPYQHEVCDSVCRGLPAEKRSP